MGIIISSFTGCGRSYFKNVYGKQTKIYDAVDELSEKHDLETYFNTVMSEVDKNDIVFIDFSSNVRSVFEENNIDFDVFYPSSERRGEFIENQVRKRSNPKDIQNLDRYFDKMIEDIENDESPNCYKHKLENKGEFLGNAPSIMQYINNTKEKP
jgi:hypothetical protein